ncbi:MAG: ABC transporter ATP-binding protein [candidate division WOR-3 bacterium]
MELAIKTENLCKHYYTGFFTKKIRALDNLNLEVKVGEIFGFLGPNGAGKTTTIKILLGLTKPSSGKALVLEATPTSAKTRRRIGFLPEAPYFYDHLTAEEFLSFCTQLQGLKNQKIAIDSILTVVGLTTARKVQLRHFSRGMLQRIGIAQALLADPELVILDEPMGGLDPIGRKEIRDVIIGLKEQGKTIFFSTHILSDVEMLCSRVGILINGKLITVGVLNEILNESFENIEVTIKGLKPDAIAQFQRNAWKTYIAEDKVTFYVSQEEEAYFLLAKAQACGGKLVSFLPRRKTLEEHFIREVAKESKK